MTPRRPARTSNRDRDKLPTLVFLGIWVLTFLLSLGFVGVMIWAIVRLVIWVTTK